MGNPSHVEKPSMHPSVVLASPLDGTTQSSDSDDCYITPGKIPAVKYSADEFSEYSPSESDSVELDNVHVLSKDYVLSRRCHLTGEQMEEIEAFVSKIQSEPGACGKDEQDQCVRLP